MNTTTRLVVRMTPEEKAAVLQKAKKAGLTASEFVRRCISDIGPVLAEERQGDLEAALKIIEASVPQMTRSLDAAKAMTEALREKIDDHGTRLTWIESMVEIACPDGVCCDRLRLMARNVKLP